MSHLRSLLSVMLLGVVVASCTEGRSAPLPRAVAGGAEAACEAGNGGIILPRGFCASVFADSLGAARHITVAPNGDVFIALRRAPEGRGGIAALRDTTGDGKADVQAFFGSPGGTGILLREGFLYHDAGTAIVRYGMTQGALQPSGPPDTIVADLPTGGHGARNFVIDEDAKLLVNIGSLSNSCQVENRTKESPGHNPCTELETRAGIWVFSANRIGQRPQDGQRFATGIRNAVAMAINEADGHLYVAQHGRDQLFEHWPALYTSEESAEKPAEELMRVDHGDNFGWPYCYYDQDLKRRVLAPEYGGDGKSAGQCERFEEPVLAFPGHWAPNALLFLGNNIRWPDRYKGGALIAFHGSWNRVPHPQAGYKVVFVPSTRGRFSNRYETFADGFAGGQIMVRDSARYRPTGLAQGPDGSLYISDDRRGRVWKVVYARR